MEGLMASFDLTYFEWSVIAPLLPNKPRGVARVDDRRVLNGIFWRLRSGAPWADIPERYGPPTTRYNRFVRWRKAGIWDKLLAALSQAYNGHIQMIDSSTVRVHQHAANGGKKGASAMHGTFPRRAYDHNPHARPRRRPRPADRAEAARGPGPRRPQRRRDARGVAGQVHRARRPRLRQRRAAR